MKKLVMVMAACLWAFSAGAVSYPPDRPSYIGHRGARGLADENTLESLKLAVDLGVDMLEFDIQRTRDGVFVLMHDETVDRTTNGHGRVDQMTLAEFKKLKTKSGFTPPTLEEVLEWLTTNTVYFMIDFKIPDPEAAKELITLVERHGLLNRAIFESPEPKIAGMIEKLRPEVETALYPTKMLLMRYYIKKYNIDDASYYYPFANPLEIMLVKKSGKRVIVWTVDSRIWIQWFKRQKVNGIISDNPRLFRPKCK